VIEDDYDSEFSANPLPALQSLDREQRVVYVGTFSKTLAPGLRIGYVIVPPHLVDLFKLVRTVTSLGISGAAQDAVTQVLARGHFVRYVRRMAGVYEQRRRIVTETLAPRLPKGFAIGPAQTGLHFALRVPIDVDDVALGDGIDDQRLLPLSRLCVVRKDCRGLVLGCSAESNSNMQRAAQAVAVHLERLQ
jgi:GntR family transcriptional regulator/MocR family aminotransferase